LCFNMTLLSFALALSGSSPCFPRPGYRLGSSRLPGSIVML